MPDSLPENPTLQDLQTYIRALCAAKGWDSNTYSEIFLLFSEEVGELAKAMRNHEQLHAQQPRTEKERFALEEEFADVLNYLLDLANYFEVDLEEAFRKKNAKNENRIWEKRSEER